MDHVRALETAHDVRDRIHLADVGEELVAETFAFGCPGDQAGDVDELDGRRDDLLRVCDCGQLLEPRIWHRHDPYVRVDGAERVVLRGDLRAGERVEQG